MPSFKPSSSSSGGGRSRQDRDSEEELRFRMPKLSRVSVPSVGDSYMDSLTKWEDADDVYKDDEDDDDIPYLLEHVTYRSRTAAAGHDQDDGEEEGGANSRDSAMSVINGLAGVGSRTNGHTDTASTASSDSDSSSQKQRQQPDDVPSAGGRQEDIRPEQVRWFYSQDGKKRTPFIGYDSLRIEFKFRQLRSGDLSSFDSCFRDLPEHELEALGSEERIHVRGGLYEIDLEQMLCSSIFWKGEFGKISRCIWFYHGNKEPIEDQFTDEIESNHLARFRDYVPEAAPLDSPKKTVNQVLHHLKFTDFHIEWYGPSEVYLYSERNPMKLMRSVSEKLGFQKSGYKLQRGFTCNATVADKQPDITHLVFVVHGVGQKIDVQKIIRNCGSLRNNANVIKEKYFSHLNDINERSEFFPVEWRSSLRLDGDTVDLITPHQIRNLREFLNSSAMDVMYYTSPLYRLELIRGLQKELNRLYRLFCQHNPYFETNGGLVSIVAHSLGCVIAYDIITGWNPMQQCDSLLSNNSHMEVSERSSPPNVSEARDDLMQRLQAAKLGIQYLEEQLKILSESETEAKGPKNNLQFCVENFFCLGSPLAVFLALRGIRSSGTGLMDDILPKTLVKRIFNVYHPTDPVAYRLEPLVLKHYSKVHPLFIHYYAATEKKPYEEMKAELIPPDPQDKRPHSPSSEDCQLLATAMTSKASPKAGESRWNFLTFGRRKDNAISEPKASTTLTPKSLAECVSSVDNDIDSPTVSDSDMLSKPELELPTTPSPEQTNIPSPIGTPGAARAGSPPTPEPAELEFRLDYMLREGMVDVKYFSTLYSHTSYWTSQDIAFFVLSYLHKTTQPQLASGSTNASPAHSSKSPAHSGKSPSKTPP